MVRQNDIYRQYLTHPVENYGVFAFHKTWHNPNYLYREYRIVDQNGDCVEWQGSIALRYYEECWHAIKQSFIEEPERSGYYDLWAVFYNPKKWFLYEPHIGWCAKHQRIAHQGVHGYEDCICGSDYYTNVVLPEKQAREDAIKKMLAEVWAGAGISKEPFPCEQSKEVAYTQATLF